MEPGDQQKSYFTRAEVAELFEVAPNTISRWVRTGRLPYVRTPGGRRRYPTAPILRLVRQFREGSEPAMPLSVSP
jgi:excisionase family DNA binding protein